MKMFLAVSGVIFVAAAIMLIFLWVIGVRLGSMGEDDGED